MDIQHPENLIVILFANCLAGDDHMDMDVGVDVHARFSYLYSHAHYCARDHLPIHSKR